MAQVSMTQSEWPRQLRVLAAVGGAALAVYAFSRMGLIRVALVGAGAALVARAVTNVEITRLLEQGTGRLAGLGSRLDRAQSGARPRRATREEPA